MDVTDSAVKDELERRLALIDANEAGDEAHAALSRTDLLVCAAIVIVAILVGMAVTL